MESGATNWLGVLKTDLSDSVEKSRLLEYKCALIIPQKPESSLNILSGQCFSYFVNIFCKLLLSIQFFNFCPQKHLVLNTHHKHNELYAIYSFIIMVLSIKWISAGSFLTESLKKRFHEHKYVAILQNITWIFH